jgi:hypothetical protein
MGEDYSIEAELSNDADHLYVLASTKRWRELPRVRGDAKNDTYKEVNGEELKIVTRGLKMVENAKLSELVVPFLGVLEWRVGGPVMALVFFGWI